MSLCKKQGTSLDEFQKHLSEHDIDSDLAAEVFSTVNGHQKSAPKINQNPTYLEPSHSESLSQHEDNPVDRQKLAEQFPVLALPNINKEEIELDLDDL